MILVSDRELCQALHAHDNTLYVSSLSSIEPPRPELVVILNLDQQDLVAKCMHELLMHYSKRKNELERLMLVFIGHQTSGLDMLGLSFVHGLVCQGFTNTKVHIYLSQQSILELHQLLQRQDFSLMSSFVLEQELPLSSVMSLIFNSHVLNQLETHWGKTPLFRSMAHRLQQQFDDIARLEKILGQSNPCLPIELKLNSACNSSEYQMQLRGCDTYVKQLQQRLSLFAKRYLEQFSGNMDNYHLPRLALMQALYDAMQKPGQQTLMLFLDKIAH